MQTGGDIRSAGDRWAFWHGDVFRVGRAAASAARRTTSARGHVTETLTAPMPATVLKVLVEPRSAVRKGDTVVVLEAMKMELPVRALADGTVTAVHCREGDLVQPDAPLVEIE